MVNVYVLLRIIMPRIYPDNLLSQLKNGILPIYLIYGNEPFLMEESATLIRQYVQTGEVSREVVTLDSINADTWKNLTHLLNNRSLFAQKQLIDLRINAKLEGTHQASFAMILELANEDSTVLIHAGSLSKSAQLSKWFMVAQNRGAVIPHSPLPAAHFSKWIKQRASQKGLTLSSQVVEQLIFNTEGNCLAAAQEIERLSLFYCPNKFPQSEILHLDQQSQFNVFDLSDAIKQQNCERILTIFKVLKEIGIAPALVLWSLSQIIRQHPQTPRRAALLAQLSQVDRQIKTSEYSEHLWPNLVEIGLNIARRPILYEKIV